MLGFVLRWQRRVIVDRGRRHASQWRAAIDGGGADTQLLAVVDKDNEQRTKGYGPGVGRCWAGVGCSKGCREGRGSGLRPGKLLLLFF